MPRPTPQRRSSSTAPSGVYGPRRGSSWPDAELSALPGDDERVGGASLRGAGHWTNPWRLSRAILGRLGPPSLGRRGRDGTLEKHEPRVGGLRSHEDPFVAVALDEEGPLGCDGVRACRGGRTESEDGACISVEPLLIALDPGAIRSRGDRILRDGEPGAVLEVDREVGGVAIEEDRLFRA